MKIILSDDEVIQAIRDYLEQRVEGGADATVERYYSDSEGGGDFMARVTITDPPNNP